MDAFGVVAVQVAAAEPGGGGTPLGHPLPLKSDDSGMGAGARGSYLSPAQVLFRAPSFLAWLIKGSVLYSSSTAPYFSKMISPPHPGGLLAH